MNRDRYKQVMKDYFEGEAKKDFKEMMLQLLSNPDPQLMQQFVSAMSIPQMSTQPPQMMHPPHMMQMVTTQPLGSQQMIS